MGKPSVEDRAAIEDLFVRYTTSLDRGDVAAIEGCFSEDCVLVTPNHGEFVGRALVANGCGRTCGSWRAAAGSGM